MNRNDVLTAVSQLLAQHAAESHRFEEIDKAMRRWSREDARRRFGIGRDKRMEPEAAERQIDIAIDSQSLFLPLVLDIFSQSMKVDNYLSSTEDGLKARARPWRYWQANNMDAAQTGITRAALQYGVAYAVVLPSFGAPGGPLITGVSPRHMTTFYGEAHAWPGEEGVSTEWPVLALEIKGNRLRLFDEENIYYLAARRAPELAGGWQRAPLLEARNFELIETRPHHVGCTPVVRFRDRWLLSGEPSPGIIDPLLPNQARIDRTAFEQGETQYSAAFKQRYIAGWTPKSDADKMQMKASAIWSFDAADIKAGQFEESDLTRYIEARKATLHDFAAIAQIPLQALGAGTISNVSAEGLAAMEAAKDRKAAEIQTALGESYEQLLRLAAHIDGDAESAADFAAEVKWRDTSARSFAQTVDGLGKLATMLDLPPEALWEDVPGFTAEKIDRIRRYRPNFDDLPPDMTLD